MDNMVLQKVWQQGQRLTVDDLSGCAFTGENAAHTFEISGKNASGAVAISGTIAGKFLRSDNVTVPVTGTASDGVASITLTEDCYAVPGRFIFSVYANDGTHNICIYCGVGNVLRTDSGEYEGGEIITDVTALINAIETAVATIPADYSTLLSAIAPTFSASTAYAAGSYVWYDGTLYKFTADHAAGSWTGTDAVAASIGGTLAGDVADLKSAFAYNKGKTKNILDLSSVVYGSINNIGKIVSNNAYSTENFIPVIAGKSYISSVDGVSGITASKLLVVAFYSSDNKANYLSRLTNVQSFTVPTGATYARFSSAAINTDNVVVGFYPKAQIEEGTVPSPFVPPFELAHVAVPYNAITGGAYSSPSALRPIGHTKIPYFDTEYSQIICYGQSLSVGADSLYVQDSVVPGCYALGALTTPSATFNPLQLASNGQHPIVSAVNSLHTLLTSNGLYAPNMVAGSYGAGGQSIAQLMSSARQAQIKTEEGYAYDITTANKYQTFLDSLTAMKTAVGEHSVCCPVIVFLQGERDYYSDEELSDLQPGSSVYAYACGDNKAKYKKYMGWLKDDMQNACVSVLGQTRKPLFVIYQVSGNFVKKHDLGINMAQQEFAEENDDVILLPAPYFTPNYGSAHLATNGYRWLGEYIAEAVFQMSVQRSKYQPLIARDIRIEGNKVFISTSGATLPLKLDAYTVEQASENGFRLWRDGTKYTVLSVSFRGNEIVLATGSSIDLSKAGSVVEVSYAGLEVGGTGNVRDSAQYGAMYSYWDDANDTGASGSLSVNYRPIDSAGNSMVGKPYPMFNWLSPFYWTQTNPS